MKELTSYVHVHAHVIQVTCITSKIHTVRFTCLQHLTKKGQALASE